MIRLNPECALVHIRVHATVLSFDGTIPNLHSTLSHYLDGHVPLSDANSFDGERYAGQDEVSPTRLVPEAFPELHIQSSEHRVSSVGLQFSTL